MDVLWCLGSASTLNPWGAKPLAQTRAIRLARLEHPQVRRLREETIANHNLTRTKRLGQTPQQAEAWRQENNFTWPSRHQLIKDLKEIDTCRQNQLAWKTGIHPSNVDQQMELDEWMQNIPLVEEQNYTKYVGEPVLVHEPDLVQQKFPNLGPDVDAVINRLIAIGIDEDEAVAMYIRADRSETCADVLLDRINMLCNVVPENIAALVMKRAPEFVLRNDLTHTLKSKIEILTQSTGLSTERLLTVAPTLLTLSHESVEERVNALCRELGITERHVLESMLRRSPILLSRSLEHVKRTFSDLKTVLPAQVDARKVICSQPTLLHCSDVFRTVQPKLNLLRELTSEEEWEVLVNNGGSGVLARALTLSFNMIERLRYLPPPSSGRPRPVATALRLNRQDYIIWAQKFERKQV